MEFLNVPPYLEWPTLFCLFLIVSSWIISLVTNNMSQVDRLWSFLPAVYMAYYAFLPVLPASPKLWLAPYAPVALGSSALQDFSPRALLLFSLVFLWMWRLTYNAYRRGVLNPHDEDYRWDVMRKQFPPWLFQIANLTFIAGMQNLILLLLGQPARIASLEQPHTPLVTSDYALAAAALVVLLLEFTADNQQFAFHTFKHAFLARGEGAGSSKMAYDSRAQWPGARLAWTADDARRGFVTRGLWRYSRHPNFICEQTFWWIIALIPLLSQDGPNAPRLSELPPIRTIAISLFTPSLWSALYEVLRESLWPTIRYIFPALVLSALFVGTTQFTEEISGTKYPAYGAYQKRVGLLPVMTPLKALWIAMVGGQAKKKRLETLVWGDAGVLTPKAKVH